MAWSNAGEHTNVRTNVRANGGVHKFTSHNYHDLWYIHEHIIITPDTRALARPPQYCILYYTRPSAQRLLSLCSIFAALTTSSKLHWSYTHYKPACPPHICEVVGKNTYTHVALMNTHYTNIPPNFHPPGLFLTPHQQHSIFVRLCFLQLTHVRAGTSPMKQPSRQKLQFSLTHSLSR